jgi:hypothetical protein
MATLIKPRQVPGVNRFEFVSNFKPAAALQATMICSDAIPQSGDTRRGSA